VSDELLTNVEDDTPAPPPPDPAPQAVAPAAPEAPVPPDDPDEQIAVEIQGGKHVPLAALRTVREELKTARERAQEADQLRQQVAHLSGQLQGFQNVAEQLQQHRPAPAGPQQADPRDVALAQKLDLYRPGDNGQAVPDTERAASIRGIIQEVAGQIADQRVLPMAQATARDRAVQNYNWALAQKDANGRTVPKTVIDEMWAKMPIEATANPEIARTLWLTGLGMTVANQQAQPAAPVAAPVHTESVGAPRARVAMSAIETKIAADRGIDAQKWGALTKDFQKGRTNVLEDD